MDKRREFERFNKFMNDIFPRASLTEKSIAECIWDKLQNEIEALSAAPTPPKEPIGIVDHTPREIRCGPVIWIGDLMSLPHGTKLFAYPPPPKAAEGVDNWDGWGDAVDEYHSFKPER